MTSKIERVSTDQQERGRPQSILLHDYPLATSRCRTLRLLGDLQHFQFLLATYEQLAVDERQRRPVVARRENHGARQRLESGRGRNARDGSVNGLDPRSGKVLWTYTNWQCIIPDPTAVDAGQGRLLITGAYGAGTAMIKVEKKGDGTYTVSELFKNPDFGAHTQPPVLHDGHFYSHYTINERSDGLVAMSLDGQVKWKTDQQPPFVRGGSILADGLLLATDGSTKLYLIEPSPTGPTVYTYSPSTVGVVREPANMKLPDAS